MLGGAIAAEALGRAGLKLLTKDFGATRLAELATVRRDRRAIETEADGTARAAPAETARATRP